MKRSGLRWAVKFAAVRICSFSAFVQIGLKFHSAGEESFLFSQKTAKAAAREAKKLKAPRNQRVFFLKVMCIISRGTAKGHDAGIHNSGQWKNSMSKECPGQTMWEFGWRIANSEENFFPLHLGKKLVDKENYEGNGKYGVMGRTSQKLWSLWRGSFNSNYLNCIRICNSVWYAKYCGCADGFKLFAFAAAALTVEWRKLKLMEEMEILP